MVIFNSYVKLPEGKRFSMLVVFQVLYGFVPFLFLQVFSPPLFCKTGFSPGFVLVFCAAVSIYCDAFADVIGLFGACFGTLICLIWPLRMLLGWGIWIWEKHINMFYPLVHKHRP